MLFVCMPQYHTEYHPIITFFNKAVPTFKGYRRILNIFLHFFTAKHLSIVEKPVN